MCVSNKIFIFIFKRIKKNLIYIYLLKRKENREREREREKKKKVIKNFFLLESVFFIFLLESKGEKK